MIAGTRKIGVAALAAWALAFAAPAAASAAPALDGEFPTSGSPKEMATGPDGAVWFVLDNSADSKEFGRIAPDGTVTEYDTPNNQAVKGISAGPDVAGGPSNRVWMTQSGGVVKWDPAAASGTVFPIATLSGPRDIAPDAQGNLWAVDSLDGLVKIAPNGTKIDDKEVSGASGRGIALGSDGRMWWADFNGSIRATTITAPYPTDTYPRAGTLQDIVAGPAGQLGFSNPPEEVGRISTAGSIEPTAAPGTDSTGVAFGGDGAYWYAQFTAQKLGRLSPDGGYSQPITLPAGSGPRYIAAGAGNTLWVGLEVTKKIARVSGVTPPPSGGGGGSGAAGLPARDSVRPVLRSLRVDSRRRRFSVRLSERARLRVRVERRRSGGRYRRVRSISRAGRRGRNVVSLGRRLQAGRYRLTVVAVDPAGNRSRSARVSFRVGRR